MLRMKRKASSLPASMIGSPIKSQHSSQEVADSVPKVLLFGLGIGVGVKCMLEFSRTEVESLGQRLREAEDMVRALRQQLEPKSQKFNIGDVGRSSAIHTTEDPDSHQHTSVAARRCTDFNFDSTPAAKTLQFTSQKEGGGPFQGIAREVDSGDSAANIADLEAELEAELEILQLNLAKECPSDKGSSGVSYLELDPLVDVVHGELSTCGLSGMHDIRKEKAHSPHIAVRHANWAVCPRELNKRLQILLQTRQEEHISELEAELKEAEYNLKDKEKLLKAWKHRTCHLTELSLSNTSGDECTGIDDKTEDSKDGQHESNSVSRGRDNKCWKNLNFSIHDSEGFLSNLNESISSSMGSTADVEVIPVTCSQENGISEGSNYCNREDFLGAIDGSSRHKGLLLLKARCDSQNSAIGEPVAGQDRNAFDSLVRKSQIENTFDVTKLPVYLGSDDMTITDNAYKTSVAMAPTENSFGVTKLSVDLGSDDYIIADNAFESSVANSPIEISFGVTKLPVDLGSDLIIIADSFESSVTESPIERSLGVSNFPVDLGSHCLKFRDTASESSTTNSPIENSLGVTKLPIDLGSDYVNTTDNAFESSMTKSSIENCFGVTQFPVDLGSYYLNITGKAGFHGMDGNCNVNNDILDNASSSGESEDKHLKLVLEGSTNPPKFLEQGDDDHSCRFNSPEVGTESWTSLGEQLLPISFSCSERDSYSEESYVCNVDEHMDMGEAVIKRIVEKAKSGSSIVRDVQTMLAVLEIQETFSASEENVLLELNKQNNFNYDPEIRSCISEVGNRKTPPSAVHSAIIASHANPKRKCANSCKRSLIEDPVYMGIQEP